MSSTTPRRDAFSDYDALLAAADTSSPWEQRAGDHPAFRADFDSSGGC